MAWTCVDPAGLWGARIALLDLTFKPNTDDMRAAPRTVLAGRLQAEGAHVHTWDPFANPAADAEPWRSTTRHASPLEAVTGVDAAIIVTAWPELASTQWAEARDRMRRPVLFDGRNLLDRRRWPRSDSLTWLSVAGWRKVATGRTSRILRRVSPLEHSGGDTG